MHLQDYFVLLPEDFYLATILNEKVETPCEVNEKKLCRDYNYPDVSYFNPVYGNDGFVIKNGAKEDLQEYFDDEKVYLLIISHVLKTVNNKFFYF